MNAFTYFRATSLDEAIREHGRDGGAEYVAGGTNLVDHLKLGVQTPDRLVDIRKLGLDKVDDVPGGGLRIGAGATNSQVAYDERVVRDYPALAQAILFGASPQLRNVATVGGNLLQKTRCSYYRDIHSACNKREPGSGCAAIGGFNRAHAVLGASEQCIATHPSDMCVALVAFEAVVRTRGLNGERAIPIEEFYVGYGEDSAKENVLLPGELITGIDIPAVPWFSRSTYVKARDRSSFEFALSSAAVALDVVGGVIRDCRVAFGGVATKPWRCHSAEATLRGERPTDDVFRRAADAEMASAVPQEHNAFKIELCKRVFVGALREVANGGR